MFFSDAIISIIICFSSFFIVLPLRFRIRLLNIRFAYEVPNVQSQFEGSKCLFPLGKKNLKDEIIHMKPFPFIDKNKQKTKHLTAEKFSFGGLKYI